jgi:DNA-binding CsgD family transcriptional regulator
MQDARYFDLILGGILEDLPWQSLVRALRERYGCTLVTLVWQPTKLSRRKDNGTGSAVWNIDEWREKYMGLWKRHDPFPAQRMQPGRIYSLDDFTARDALLQSDLYRDCMQPTGMEHGLCLCLEEAGGYQAWLYLFRNDEVGNFDHKVVSFLRELAPRLQEAIHVFATLKRSRIERDIYESSLAGMHIGSIIFDQSENVLRIDRVAQAILEADRSLAIENGHIHIRPKEKALEFSLICKQLLESDNDAKGMVIPRAGKPELRLLIRRMPEHFDYFRRQSAALTMFIADPVCTHIDIPKRLVAELFGLTKSESAVASLVVEGAAISEITAALGLTENTVRSYIKQIYAKVGVKRQAELIRMVSKSLAILAPEPTPLRSVVTR